MKLDQTKILGYDKLTEEQKALLDTLEIDGNAYVDKKTFDKTASELADAKKKITSTKTEADENNSHLQNELEELRTKIGQMEKEKTVATHTAKFIALGYDEELAQETAAALVDSDYETVFANQKKFLNAHDTETKTKLLQGTPTPSGSQAGSNKMTKEKLRAMTPAERFKFSQEHQEEYKEIYGG